MTTIIITADPNYWPASQISVNNKTIDGLPCLATHINGLDLKNHAMVLWLKAILFLKALGGGQWDANTIECKQVNILKTQDIITALNLDNIDTSQMLTTTETSPPNIPPVPTIDGHIATIPAISMSMTMVLPNRSTMNQTLILTDPLFLNLFTELESI